jgi:hypothetical protein
LSVSAGGCELRQHTLLRAADSCHLRACCCLRGGALLRIRCAIALIAESARVDSRGGFVLKFDDYIDFAGFRKLIFEVTDRSVICVLRAIEVVALSVGDVISSTNQVRKHAEGQ